MLHAAQIRAARALLDWRQQDLAQACKIGLATIQRIERMQGLVQGHISTILRIQQAFEEAGILFLAADEFAGVGVRLVHPAPTPGQARQTPRQKHD